MNLFDQRRNKIIIYGIAVLAVIGVLFLTDVWPAYVMYIVNLLKKAGIQSLPLFFALFLTFVCVYVPVYLASYFIASLVRPHLVVSMHIEKKLGDISSNITEVANYVQNLQSEISEFTQFRDDIKEEIHVLEQIKEQNIKRLSGKFLIKLRDRRRDKLFAQIQAFIYGVLASLVASYAYAFLKGS